jgi:hypothetical protein
MAPIGGLTAYPSLQEIADLVRTLVNDDMPGATNTPGEGQILTNASVTLINLMNSAIRETYRDCRIMGQPTLIRDNYILEGLPPVNSNLGVGVMNPAVQVALQYTGFYDGLQMWSQWLLPQDMILPLELWERQAGTQNPFGLMRQSTGALAPRNQTYALGEWEWRGDEIWMNGATESRDVRLRYVATYADLAATGIDWTQTYVPISDSQEAIADKIAARYTARLGGAQQAYAQQRADRSILRLRQQVTRSRQEIDFQRPSYGNGAASMAGNPATFLY